VVVMSGHPSIDGRIHDQGNATPPTGHSHNFPEGHRTATTSAASAGFGTASSGGAGENPP
jgi:hypothetical protein